MDVSIVGANPNTSTELQVDPTFQAARAALRPLEYGGLNGTVLGGHYSVGAETGSIAAGAAAAADIFHMFWASPTKLMIVKKVLVQVVTLTAFTTLGGAPLELIVGHNATADGTGGTALTMNTGNKDRISMAPTEFASAGAIRIATTGALGALTGISLETNALAACSGAPWLQHQSAPMYLWDQRDAGDHPLVMTRGDVLMVRTGNAVGATGVWVASITVNWVEGTNY